MTFLEWLQGIIRPRPTPTPTGTPVISDGPAFLAAHNSIRTIYLKPPMYWNSILEADAQSHASLMARLHDMNHFILGEPDTGQRLTAHGYHWSWAAENIAADYPDIPSVMRAWKNSPGHLENILGPSTEIGAAVVVANNGVPYYSVTFARPMAQSAPMVAGAPQQYIPVITRGEDGTTSSLYMSFEKKDNDG